jgi:serine phosphatase RsbU (regulator of sigma subunit)
VPVSSPTIPLGTLWAFSQRQRDFTPQETNLLEIVAGRLAADLDREMLLAAGTKARGQTRQLEAAALWLSDRLPSVAPLLDDYEVAGWTRPAAEVAASFHDWAILPDGRLALAVGAAEGRLLAGALGAASLHAAVKSHASYRHTAAELALRVNDTLWTASPGDQHAGLAYAVLDEASGALELALAGGVGAILIGAEHHRILGADGQLLGSQPELALEKADARLAPGEVLLLISAGVRSALDAAGLRIGENAIASLVSKHLRDSADDLSARLRKLLDIGEPPCDLTLVLLKRRGR